MEDTMSGIAGNFRLSQTPRYAASGMYGAMEKVRRDDRNLLN
jgi:hypothetical protein